VTDRNDDDTNGGGDDETPDAAGDDDTDQFDSADDDTDQFDFDPETGTEAGDHDDGGSDRGGDDGADSDGRDVGGGSADRLVTGADEEEAAPAGEPGLSSDAEYGEAPQYFDPVAETADELPHTAESSRSEMMGLQSTGERPPIAEQVDDEASKLAGLDRARMVGNLLDDAVTVPGTSFKIGLDPILGILPGGGDLVAAVGSLYIVFEAARAGVPRSELQKMLGIVAVDVVAGSVPIIGVLFDAFWKANKWNVATFEEHVESDLD